MTTGVISYQGRNLVYYVEAGNITAQFQGEQETMRVNPDLKRIIVHDLQHQVEKGAVRESVLEGL